MSDKTLQFIVTIPGIPEGMSNESVLSWLKDEISHPYDAYFEADVRVTPIREIEDDKERAGNGCMIYTQPAQEGE